MLAILNTYLFFLFLTTLAVSDSLVLFFISWVGLNIALYGILLKSFNSYNKEMTLKYFISGSVITVFLLFSIMLFFMEYFTFNYQVSDYLFFLNSEMSLDIGVFYISTFQKLSYTLLVSALLFKLGAFPFHFYLSDIYQSLNEKETMFLYTIALKLAIFFTLLKFLSNFWYLNQFISDLILVSGFGSVFVSSFSILKQYKLSKIWAYSYLNSVGFTLISLSSGILLGGGEVSFFSAKVYFVTYILTWFGIFDFIANIAIKQQGSNIMRKLYYVSDLFHISESVRFFKKNPQISSKVGYLTFKKDSTFYILVPVLSLLGLPPTLGFFSKALVYLDLVSSSQTSLLFLLLLATTPLISFAYLKLVIYSVVASSGFGVKNHGYVVRREDRRDFIISYKDVTLLIISLPFFVFFLKSF